MGVLLEQTGNPFNRERFVSSLVKEKQKKRETSTPDIQIYAMQVSLN